MKNVGRVSVLVLLFSFLILIIIRLDEKRSIVVQNKIIDSTFYYDYSGYIDIPKYGVKRLIKSGNYDYVLDNLYVLLYQGDLSGDDLIVLAGHNVSSVFSKLHDIKISDYVYITGNYTRRFVVYDKLVVRDDDFSFFSNRKNEMVLFTCDKHGYRLLVFLREDL